MKKLLSSLALIFLGASFASADINTTMTFRMDNANGGYTDFLDLRSWDKYQENSTWYDIALGDRTVLPWARSQYTADGARMNLKLEEITATISSDFGTAESAMNVNFDAFYIATLNIEANVYIKGSAGQDGDSANVNSTINVNGAYTFSADNIDLAYFNVAGTDNTNRATFNGNANINARTGSYFTFENSNLNLRNFNMHSGSNDATNRIFEVKSNNTITLANEGFNLRSGSSATGNATLLVSGDNNVFNPNGSMRFGVEDGSTGGGTVTWHISGNDNTVNLKGIETDVDRSGGKVEMLIEGTGNQVINSEGNINLDGWAQNKVITGGEVGVRVLGSGNSWSSNNVNLGGHDGQPIASAGKAYFYAGSSDETKKNIININDINMGLSSEANSSYVTEFKLMGNTVLRGGDGSYGTNINVGSNRDGYAGGVSVFMMENDNNDVLVRDDINILNKNNNTGGTAKFLIDGNNNKVNTNNINMARSDSSTDITAYFLVDGVGNEIIVRNNFEIRTNANLKAGFGEVILGGKDSKILITNMLNIADGYADTVGNSARFTVSGENNTLTAGTVQIGAFGDPANGFSNMGHLKIEGSTHTIEFGRVSLRRVEGIDSGEDAWLAQNGGFIEFVADADGFSTLYTDDFNKNLNDPLDLNIDAGYLVLDFTMLEGVYNASEFIFISAGNDISQYNLDKIYSILRDASDTLTFSFIDNAKGGKDLVGIYTSIIPEPSTYAAILGALALALAVYRRKTK